MSSPLLYHADLMWLLHAHRVRRAKQVAGLLDRNRKGSNAAYQAVVDGRRPSRADKAEQVGAEGLSRLDLEDYWLGRIEKGRQKS